MQGSFLFSLGGHCPLAVVSFVMLMALAVALSTNSNCIEYTYSLLSEAALHTSAILSSLRS